jgi:hypothetical protein
MRGIIVAGVSAAGAMFCQFNFPRIFLPTPGVPTPLHNYIINYHVTQKHL